MGKRQDQDQIGACRPLIRVPVKLEDKHTRQEQQLGALVDAFLCLDVPAAVLADTARRCAPLWNAGIERRERLGLPPLENPHWDWSATVTRRRGP